MPVKQPVPKLGGGLTPPFYGLVGFLRLVSMGFEGFFLFAGPYRGVCRVKRVFWPNLGFWRGYTFKATAP